MSLFAKDFARLAAEEHRSLPATDLDDEVADGVARGVVVERRSLLWLSAGAVGSLLAGPSLRAQDPERAEKPAKTCGLSHAEFLEQALPLARRLVASDGEDEEAYLMTLAALMSRLAEPAALLRATMQEFRKKHGRDGERFPLAAVSFRLEPGGGFSHHDHLDYNGVILGLEGEVRIRNFDILDAAPELGSSETFRIRETRDDLILPGRFSTLGRTRENVHELVAGSKGARVLDVFTFFTDKATSRYLDVEKQPRDPEQRIYDAVWRQRRR